MIDNPMNQAQNHINSDRQQMFNADDSIVKEPQKLVNSTTNPSVRVLSVPLNICYWLELVSSQY